MKRGRPGIIVTVLAHRDARDNIVLSLFHNTTSLGVRFQEMRRQVLIRRMEAVHLPDGTVRIKIADLGSGSQKMMPEYQDCQKIAKKTGRPVREIIEDALQVMKGKKDAGKPVRKRARSS